MVASVYKDGTLLHTQHSSEHLQRSGYTAYESVICVDVSVV